MKKIKKYLGFAGLFALLAPAMSSCSTQSADYYIYVLNAEDYIDDSLIDSFQEMVLEEDNVNVQVVYETYDTNETMYNTLKTGKQTYDALCCSDYMIQRLVREDLAHSFDDGYEKGLLDNYKKYVSPFLQTYDGVETGVLNTIPVEVPIEKDDHGKITKFDKTKNLNSYALGYMWGTLGIQYNPSKIVETNGHLFRNSKEELKNATDEELKQYIIDLFNSTDGWSALWDPCLKGTTSIKDSMRDTYAIGILEVYKDYFLEDGANFIDSYDERNKKFNSSDDSDIKVVQDKLIELKENIFGFEVDSGKDDIVKGIVSANTAWSGDVVNSIQHGFYSDDDFSIERPDEEKVELYYATSALGANVWFDAWCLPKHEDKYYESKEYEYTLKFLDFLSSPENAVTNMAYNGYTSFIGATGETPDSIAILNYILDLCDVSDGYEDTEDYDEYDISYYFNFIDDNGNPLQRLEFDTFDPYDELPVLDEAEETNEEEPTTEESTSEEESEEEFESRHYVFEADENGKLKIIIKTDLSSLEGRILTAQFFPQEMLDKLYVMRDFGGQNIKMVSMWENIKVNPLPVAVVVILLVFLGLGLTYLALFTVLKKIKIKKRKALREEK